MITTTEYESDIKFQRHYKNDHSVLIIVKGNGAQLKNSI
jgi:hypothetical protein